MGVNVDHERAWVSRLYSGRRWKKQVARMPASQVLAIYIRAHQTQQPKKSKES